LGLLGLVLLLLLLLRLLWLLRLRLRLRLRLLLGPSKAMTLEGNLRGSGSTCDEITMHVSVDWDFNLLVECKLALVGGIR
jgi:hypothetical protein